MSNFTKNIVAAYFSAVTKLLQKVIGLVSTLFLARLLTPEDFGLVSLVWLIIMFTEAFAESGAEDYIIQKETIDNTDLNTAWTLNVMLKSGVMLLVVGASPLIASYYDEPQLVHAIVALSVVVIVSSLRNPHMIVLLRERDYKPSFKIGIISKIFGVFATITSAFLFRNFWALIIGHLTSASVRIVLTYLWFDYRPTFTLNKVKEQFNFSQWLLARNIFGYCRSQFDTFLVSTTYGVATLGGYHVSKYVSRLPASDGIVPLMSPLLASFSNVQADIEKLKYQVVFSLIILFALLIPIGSFMYTNADVLSLILLGEQWVSYADIFAVFSLSVFSMPIYNFAVALLYIDKKPKQVLYYDIASFCVLVVSLLIVSTQTLLVFVSTKIAVDVFLSFCFLVYAVIQVGIKRVVLFAVVAFLIFSTVLCIAFGAKELLHDQMPIFLYIVTAGILFFFGVATTYGLTYKCFLKNTPIGHHMKYLEWQYVPKIKILRWM